MRILNIIQCTNLGGMEQAALDSLALLKGAGHEVLMLSLHPVGGLKSLAKEEGVELMGSARYRPFGFGNIPWLLREIKRFDPDRILVTGHNYGAMIAGKLSGVQTYLSIHFLHGSPLSAQWKIFYFLARRICKGIHFATRYIYDEVADRLLRFEHVVSFPYLFLEADGAIGKQDARAQLSVPVDAYIVGNAGWLIKRKAFDVFLDTAALVLKQQPNARFLIAGDGEERERLECQASQLGIGDSVVFMGWLKDLDLFYRSLDVLLFNSRSDALGRTPIEALCYGVPVVASVTNGGLEEFIRHGKDGFLIDHHDPQALAEEVLKLNDDSTYREKCSCSGKERALELGAPSVHLKNLSDFLELE